MSDCVCCCLWYYITTVSVLLKKQAAKRYRNRTEWKVIAQYIIKTQLPERLTRNKKDSLVKSMFKLEWNCSSVILAQSKLSNCTWKLLSRYICFKPQLFYARAFSPHYHTGRLPAVDKAFTTRSEPDLSLHHTVLQREITAFTLRFHFLRNLILNLQCDQKKQLEWGKRKSLSKYLKRLSSHVPSFSWLESSMGC